MIDTTSVTWQTIAAWLDAEIDAARERNDAHLAPEQTTALRARIEVLKDLRQLPESFRRAESARIAALGQYQAPTFMDPRDY